MYYEAYHKKTRRRRRRRGGCLGALLKFLIKLAALAVVLAMLAAAALYFMPVSLFMVERGGDLSPTDGLPSSPFNILLLGVDVLNDGYQRSDAMMIVSVDGTGVKLTSLQRDLLVDIPGHGQSKLNAAYAIGGPELAVRTVNETFGMNILRYAVVDFTSVVKLIDALGGVEIDISEAEMEQINYNMLLSAPVFIPLGYTGTELTVHGEATHLDGLQTLAYARIRKLDSDFMRTSRQRTVIRAVIDRIKENLLNPAMLKAFVETAFDSVDTTLSAFEITSLGAKAVLSGGLETLRLPANDTFTDDGSSLTLTDRQANIDALYRFLYEE